MSARSGGGRIRAVVLGAAWIACLGTLAGPAPPDGPADAAATIRERLERDAWDDALGLARESARRWPDDADVGAAFGEALWRAGEIEAAEARLAALCADRDPPARAMVVLGLIRSAQARHDEAAEWMDRALARAPDDRYVRYWTAGAQPSRADAMRAIERYLEIAGDDDPDRIEGAHGTLRLYRALGDREVWKATSRPERVEVELDRLRGLDLRTVGWSVDVVLGTRDRPVRLLLDTGSPGLFLDRRSVRKRGLEPISEETTFGGGGSGRHPSSRGILPRFRLGSLEFSNALVTTSDDAIDDLGRYAGLLGTNALEGYRIVVDLRRGRLTLEAPPERPEPGGAPYWTVGGQLLVRARAQDGPEGLFLLDTGATRTLLDLDFAARIERADVGGRARVRSYGGLRDDARTVEGVVLEFQGFATDGGRVNAVDLTRRSRLGGVQISGFLGLDLLDGKELVLDTVHRRVWLRDARGGGSTRTGARSGSATVSDPGDRATIP